MRTKHTFGSCSLTVEHDLARPLLPDGDVGGAVGDGALLRRVALVEAAGVDLQNVGGPQHEVEALEAGDAARVLHHDDVVADAAVARAPHRDRVGEDGERRVGDGRHARHDRLRHVLPLEGRREVAAAQDACKLREQWLFFACVVGR